MSKEIAPQSVQQGLGSPAYHDVTSQLMAERMERNQDGFFGAWDLMLATKGSLIVGTLGETLQEERAGYLAKEGDYKEMFPGANIHDIMAVDPHSHDPFMLFASIPLDLKAAAVGIAAFGAVSAARRIRRSERFPQDASKAIRQAQEAEGFVPHNEKSGRAFRLRRKLARAAITSVTVVGSYQAAKHGTQMEDLTIAGGIDALAIGGLSVARFRDKRADRKLRKQAAEYRNSLGYGDSRAIY